jgi:hypothetical protein
MKRTLAPLIVVIALIALAPVASAQYESPATGSPSPTPSLLAGLGYPDLEVTTDGTDFTPPSEVAAGRYHLIFRNNGTTAPVSLTVAQPPEGTTVDELIQTFSGTQVQEEPPELFYHLKLVSGLFAVPGSSSEAIVDLTPGDWAIGIDIENEDGSTTSVIKPLTVSGEFPEVEDPPADIEVTAIDLAFEMPDTLPSGPHILKFTNTGAIPHFLAIQTYPEPVTAEQIQATLNMFIGTPVASPVATLDPEKFQEVFSTPTLSTGQTAWFEVNLQPGQHEAFCFISGPGTLPIHAAMGMFKIFNVE